MDYFSTQISMITYENSVLNFSVENIKQNQIKSESNK